MALPLPAVDVQFFGRLVGLSVADVVSWFGPVMETVTAYSAPMLAIVQRRASTVGRLTELPGNTCLISNLQAIETKTATTCTHQVALHAL